MLSTSQHVRGAYVIWSIYAAPPNDQNCISTVALKASSCSLSPGTTYVDGDETVSR